MSEMTSDRVTRHQRCPETSQRAGEGTRTPNLLCLGWVLVNVGHYWSIVVMTRAGTGGLTFDRGHW